MRDCKFWRSYALTPGKSADSLNTTEPEQAAADGGLSAEHDCPLDVNSNVGPQLAKMGSQSLFTSLNGCPSI